MAVPGRLAFSQGAGCPSPVVVEIRAGVYRKNVQIVHIYGVRAPRYKKVLSEEERDSAFKKIIRD